MNEALSLLLAHRSIRNFTEGSIAPAELDAIIAAGHRCPTSSNAQEVSVIVVQDAAKRAKIAELCGGQPWVAQAPVFLLTVIDFNKTAHAAKAAGVTQVIHEDAEGFLVSTFDAGLILATMMTAARSLGFGIVPIGGIRRDPQAVIDLLGLPPLTFPVCGLSIGHIAKDAPQKPRLPIESFRHDESYNDAAIEAAIKTYDDELMTYWQSLGRADGEKWSESTAGKYKTHYFPEVAVVAKKQGF